MAFGSTEKTKIKTKRITSHSSTNAAKTDVLKNHFKHVLHIKNKQSLHIFKNKESFLTQHKKQALLNQYDEVESDQIYSWELQKLYQMTMDFYQNWLDRILDNNKFFIQKGIDVKFYKRDIKNKEGQITNKEGDVKFFEIVKERTPLASLMNYLIYVEENLLDTFIKLPSVKKDKEGKIKPISKEKMIEINDFNNYLNSVRAKPYWNKIKELLKNKKQRLLSKINRPIKYSTGTYMKIPQIGQTKHSYIQYDESNAEFKHFYHFKIGKGKNVHFDIQQDNFNVIRIPLAYNQKYHGNSIHDYNLAAAHTVKLNKKNRIDIGMTFDDEHEYFQPLNKNKNKFETIVDKNKIAGIDLNVATNFCTIALSNGECISFDYDREYIKEVVELIKLYNEKGYKYLSKKQLETLEKKLAGVEFYFKKLISEILHKLIDLGITDISMENLNLNETTASFLKDQELKIKYTRLVRLLRLSSVKTWFEQQANNLGLRVHLTPAAYTSQTCSKCHCIIDTKREGRFFTCFNCNHTADADENAAHNVRNRIVIDVLRERFHKYSQGQLVPLMIKRQEIRTMLCELFKTVNESQSPASDSGGMALRQETPSFRAE